MAQRQTAVRTAQQRRGGIAPSSSNGGFQSLVSDSWGFRPTGGGSTAPGSATAGNPYILKSTPGWKEENFRDGSYQSKSDRMNLGELEGYGNVMYNFQERVKNSDFQRDQSAYATQARQDQASNLQAFYAQDKGYLQGPEYQQKMATARTQKDWQAESDSNAHAYRMAEIALANNGGGGGGGSRGYSTGSGWGTGSLSLDDQPSSRDRWAADKADQARREGYAQEAGLMNMQLSNQRYLAGLDSADKRYQTFLPMTQNYNFQYWR